MSDEIHKVPFGVAPIEGARVVALVIGDDQRPVAVECETGADGVCRPTGTPVDLGETIRAARLVLAGKSRLPVSLESRQVSMALLSLAALVSGLPDDPEAVGHA